EMPVATGEDVEVRRTPHTRGQPIHDRFSDAHTLSVPSPHVTADRRGSDSRQIMWMPRSALTTCPGPTETVVLIGPIEAENSRGGMPTTSYWPGGTVTRKWPVESCVGRATTFVVPATSIEMSPSRALAGGATPLSVGGPP